MYTDRQTSYWLRFRLPPAKCATQTWSRWHTCPELQAWSFFCLGASSPCSPSPSTFPKKYFRSVHSHFTLSNKEIAIFSPYVSSPSHGRPRCRWSSTPSCTPHTWRDCASSSSATSPPPRSTWCWPTSSWARRPWLALLLALWIVEGGESYFEMRESWWLLWYWLDIPAQFLYILALCKDEEKLSLFAQVCRVHLNLSWNGGAHQNVNND